MSVLTTADEKLDQAKAAIQTAAEALAEITIQRCYGHDTYTEDYQREIAAALVHVCDARAALEGPR